MQERRRTRTSGGTARGATTSPYVALNLLGLMWTSFGSESLVSRSQTPTDAASGARSSRSSRSDMKDKDKRKGPSPSAAARDLKELPVRDPGGRKHRSFVFYGRSGTGKTTVFSTFPGKKLLLDIKDEGDDSLQGVADIKVMDIRHWDDMEIAYWWIKRNPKAYGAVGLDTMSQLQQLA